MSHDETSGPVTRKERRAARYGKRQAAPRYVFSAAAHVRKDWSVEDVMDRLEDRAKGYNGILRQLLCTAAAMLKDAVSEDLLKAAAKEGSEAEDQLACDMGMIPTSKRNQQPGRLSGGEREALKKFVAHIVSAGILGDHTETMAMGRALLTKVRKRALGDQAEETVDCSALMPVGVEDDGS